MDHKAATFQAGTNAWHSLAVEAVNQQNEIVARAEADRRSPWFSGHFPGEPILPGIAQLHMVFEIIQQTEGVDLVFKGLKRVRFKKVIQPEEKIEIVTGPLEDNPLTYSFRILVRGEIACNGILITERSNA